jgi:hypothetical protein
MSLLISLGAILLSGAVGGTINALISDNGFITPREETIGNVRIIRPGFAGNILIGAVAAFIYWGFNGEYSGTVIYGTITGTGTDGVGLTLSSVALSILVGIAGARWLTNVVDKNLLHAAAVTAAAAGKSFEDSQRMAVSTPAQAFNIAKRMYMER